MGKISTPLYVHAKPAGAVVDICFQNIVSVFGLKRAYVLGVKGRTCSPEGSDQSSKQTMGLGMAESGGNLNCGILEDNVACDCKCSCRLSKALLTPRELSR